MTAAAFQATYSDWRLVKGRKVVQIVFEVPLEGAALVHDVLGGMPDPGKSVWCAIARLNAGAGASPAGRSRMTEQRAEQNNPGGEHEVGTNDDHHDEVEGAREEPAPGRPRKSFHEMSPAQQAGILCADKSFWNYLNQTTWVLRKVIGRAEDEETAAAVVRLAVKVTSRSEIEKHTNCLARWNSIVSDYRAWMREPETVG